MADEIPLYEELKSRLALAEGTLKAISHESIDAMIGKQGVYLLRLKEVEDALEESVEELTEYAYALTHNLKEPLRAIHNYVDFLFEDVGDTLAEAPRSYLEGIRTAIRQSDRQFSDLETIYRIRKHAMQDDYCRIPELIGEIRSICQTNPMKKLILQPRDWPVFRCEKFLLRHILTELICNGFKFNRSEEKRIEVGWQPAGEDRIELLVRDNGIGIAPQYHDQVFRIFQRLHTTREYEGTGIGLAIVKRAAKRMGGTLRIESTVGEGSLFCLGLPKSVIAL
jgi:light-regulated signal transduction histidine kinase (bacteriophytochrome)